MKEDHPKPVVLRPSNKAWPKCSAQPWLLHKHRNYIPKDPGNQYTNEGHEAHERAYLHLLGKKRITNKKDGVLIYTDEVERDRTANDALYVETKIPLWYDPGYLCTVDAALVSENRLDIKDLKWGMGVDVEAQGNTQLAIYWRSIYEDLLQWDLIEHMEFDALCTLTIVQPRHWNLKKIDTWEVTVGELLDLTDSLALQAEKIYQKKGLEFSPSDETCQFCPAKAVCVSAHQWELENLDVMEGDLDAIKPEVIKELFNRSGAIRKWLDWISKFVGDSVSSEGTMSEWFQWARGTRQGNTQWHDPNKAMRALRKQFPDLKPGDFYEKKFLSPTKLLAKLVELDPEIDKDFLASQDLTFRPPPKQVIRPVEEGQETQADKIDEAFRNI